MGVSVKETPTTDAKGNKLIKKTLIIDKDIAAGEVIFKVQPTVMVIHNSNSYSVSGTTSRNGA